MHLVCRGPHELIQLRHYFVPIDQTFPLISKRKAREDSGLDMVKHNKLLHVMVIFMDLAYMGAFSVHFTV